MGAGVTNTRAAERPQYEQGESIEKATCVVHMGHGVTMAIGDTLRCQEERLHTDRMRCCVLH